MLQVEEEFLNSLFNKYNFLTLLQNSVKRRVEKIPGA